MMNNFTILDANIVQHIQNQMNSYHNLYVGCLIAGFVFLAIALILFFVLKIPNVFMRITGLSKKKEIKEMTDSVEYTSQLSRRLTKGKKGKKKKTKVHMMTETGTLKTAVKNTNEQYASGEINSVPQAPDYQYTEGNQTTILSDSTDGNMDTTLLSREEGDGVTTLLDSTKLEMYDKESINYKLIDEILFIHTNEEII